MTSRPVYAIPFPKPLLGEDSVQNALPEAQIRSSIPPVRRRPPRHPIQSCRTSSSQSPIHQIHSLRLLLQTQVQRQIQTHIQTRWIPIAPNHYPNRQYRHNPPPGRSQFFIRALPPPSPALLQPEADLRDELRFRRPLLLQVPRCPRSCCRVEGERREGWMLELWRRVRW